MLAVLVAVLVALHGSGFGIERAHVARLQVSGLITEDPKLTQASWKSWRDDDKVKALIVSIDSPGGSVAGGESLHDAIAHVAAKKPVVTVMGGLAASAGYMIAVPGRPHLRPRGDADRLDRRVAGGAGGLRPAGQDRGRRADHRLRPAEGPAQLHPSAVAARAAGAARPGDG